jgi:hypothetical protein
MNVFDRDFLLALAVMAVEGFQQRCIGAGQLGLYRPCAFPLAPPRHTPKALSGVEQRGWRAPSDVSTRNRPKRPRDLRLQPAEPIAGNWRGASARVALLPPSLI